jgi:hypothetical protein
MRTVASWLAVAALWGAWVALYVAFSIAVMWAVSRLFPLVGRRGRPR